MANKYIRHGETYCGDGTTSAAATSNGGVGAWNNINVFEGTAPAYGALVVGDVVYIRSKDATGADMVFAKSSGTVTYLGQATATANAPTSWILDDGTVWPGINGMLKYTTASNANKISFRANNFFKSSQNNIRFATTQTTGSSGDGTTWIDVFGVVDGLHFDTSVYTNTAPRSSIGFNDGGTLINPIFKLGAMPSFMDAAWSFFTISGTNRGDIFIINPDIEMLGTSINPSGFFGIAQSYARNTHVYGGRIYGVGSMVTNQALCSVAAGYTSGMVKCVGLQFPRSMNVSSSRILPSGSSSSAGTFIEIIGCDDGLGGHHEACWGWMTSRTDNNPPYLSALSLDSNSTPWAWRVYPAYADLRSPMQIPTTKMYTGASSAKTVSLEMLIADTMLASGAEVATKQSLWMAVSYTDSSGIPRSDNTRGFGNLDASTAPWSATVWGMISLVKKKLSVTTQYPIKQDSVITVTLFGYAKSASVNDILFVDPDFGVN